MPIQRLFTYADCMQHSADLEAAVQEMVQGHDARIFLVEAQWQPEHKRLRLFVDTEEGIRMRECSHLHVQLRNLLTLSGWIDDDYSLEISSPGVGKPLKHERQYRQNIGRTVELEMLDGTKVAGRLTHFADQTLSLEIIGESKPQTPVNHDTPAGTEAIDRTEDQTETHSELQNETKQPVLIPLQNIRSTKVVASFN